jgi:hypothetical protein
MAIELLESCLSRRAGDPFPALFGLASDGLGRSAGAEMSAPVPTDRQLYG